VFFRARSDAYSGASNLMTELKDSQKEEVKIIWTNIIHLTPDSHSVNVRFKIVKRGERRQVTSASLGRKYELTTFEIADSTAKVTLTLWNDDIDILEKDGDYCLLNGYITLRDECMSLSKGRSGSIDKSSTSLELIKEETNMSLPFAWKPKRLLSRPTTARTLGGSSGREVRRYSSRKSF
jgi:hypothetical protein